MSPSKSYFPFWTKISRPAEHKIMDIGSRKNISQWITMCNSEWHYFHLHPLMLDLGLLGIGERSSNSGCWLRLYAAFWSLSKSPRYCTITESSKLSHFLASQLLQDNGERDKPKEFHEHGPNDVLCRKLSSLIRNNDMWNNMMMKDKTFSKSMDGSFSRSIISMQGKSIFKIYHF